MCNHLHNCCSGAHLLSSFVCRAAQRTPLISLIIALLYLIHLVAQQTSKSTNISATYQFSAPLLTFLIKIYIFHVFPIIETCSLFWWVKSILYNFLLNTCSVLCGTAYIFIFSPCQGGATQFSLMWCGAPNMHLTCGKVQSKCNDTRWLVQSPLVRAVRIMRLCNGDISCWKIPRKRSYLWRGRYQEQSIL